MLLPDAVTAAPVSPGAKNVLLVLWKYAARWRPGDGARFVFPAVRTLAAKLGRKLRGVYANLASLQSAGWIERASDGKRKGWNLYPTPLVPSEVDEQNERDVQLDFVWPDAEVETVVEERAERTAARELAPACEAAVLARGALEHAPPCNHDPYTTGSPTNRHADDDDADRIWDEYERERVEKLGGAGAVPSRCARTPRAPRALRELHAKLGGGADAWRRIAHYGSRAIDLALQAIQRHRRNAGSLVYWRADGHEWSMERFTAVAGWDAASRLASARVRASEPEPMIAVDGAGLDRWEHAAWKGGGIDAVRAMRAEQLSPLRAGDLAAEFLASIGSAA